MTVFAEGEKVQLVDGDGTVGKVDFVYETFTSDTDRPIWEPSYDVDWEDGEYSTHTESELVALEEG